MKKTKRSKVSNYLLKHVFASILSDEQFLRLKFKQTIGEELNLKDPKTFNEKMQWLKLNDRRDIYTTMADKYKVKEFVAKRAGKKYVIPMLGVYDKFEDINFGNLPNQFVIKCTHDSGGLVICRDKSKINIEETKKKINRSLKHNYFKNSREWPYKNIKPRILVEKFIKDDKIDDLRDYKFLCFGGEPKYVYMTVKNDNIFEDYFDMDYEPVNINHGFPRSGMEIKKPEAFEEMKEVARKISKGTPFLRVDLHYAGGKVLFGETTFYDWAGFVPFKTEKMDRELGDMIDLSLAENNGD